MVTVLATLGMFGIVFFYLSSQATWLDGSTQAISQREASVILGALTDSLRSAASVSVFDSPDSLRQGISIKDATGTEYAPRNRVPENRAIGSDLPGLGPWNRRRVPPSWPGSGRSPRTRLRFGQKAPERIRSSYRRPGGDHLTADPRHHLVLA